MGCCSPPGPPPTWGQNPGSLGSLPRSVPTPAIDLHVAGGSLPSSSGEHQGRRQWMDPSLPPSLQQGHRAALRHSALPVTTSAWLRGGVSYSHDNLDWPRGHRETCLMPFSCTCELKTDTGQPFPTRRGRGCLLGEILTAEYDILGSPPRLQMEFCGLGSKTLGSLVT